MSECTGVPPRCAVLRSSECLPSMHQCTGVPRCGSSECLPRLHQCPGSPGMPPQKALRAPGAQLAFRVEAEGCCLSAGFTASPAAGSSHAQTNRFCLTARKTGLAWFGAIACRWSIPSMGDSSSLSPHAAHNKIIYDLQDRSASFPSASRPREWRGSQGCPVSRHHLPSPTLSLSSKNWFCKVSGYLHTSGYPLRIRTWGLNKLLALGGSSLTLLLPAPFSWLLNT